MHPPKTPTPTSPTPDKPQKTTKKKKPKNRKPKPQNVQPIKKNTPREPNANLIKYFSRNLVPIDTQIHTLTLLHSNTEQKHSKFCTPLFWIKIECDF